MASPFEIHAEDGVSPPVPPAAAKWRRAASVLARASAALPAPSIASALVFGHLVRTLGGLDKTSLRIGEIPETERDIGEPEGRFGSIVEAFGERQIKPARDGGLSGPKRRIRYRQAVLQGLSGFQSVVEQRRARGPDQDSEDRNCRRRAPKRSKQDSHDHRLYELSI